MNFKKINDEIKKQLIILNGSWTDDLSVLREQFMYFIRQYENMTHIRAGSMNVPASKYFDFELTFGRGYIEILCYFYVQTKILKIDKIFISDL